MVRDVVSGANPPQHLQQKNDPQLEALIFGIMDAGLLCPSEDA
ncbi:hypothetical protein APY03_1490 [Variovorax sp. WDL1]|nr:hypothetical protein APY03_1490 [Variovorax sp. WDL1]